MTASALVFYILAFITLGAALLAVTTRQIFRAAIYLLFSLIGVAGIYFWMQYEFVAAVQVVVYVGGIVVLIIFSIFLTQQSGKSLALHSMGRRFFAALACFCGFGLVLLQFMRQPFKLAAIQGEIKIADIGRQLLDVEQHGMALPFEVISILLLAALIGCIVIAMRKTDQPVEAEQEATQN